MTIELAEALQSHEPDIEIMEDYSGRAMYGKETVAVTAESMMTILDAALQVNDYELVYENIGSLRYDSFGMGVVVY